MFSTTSATDAILNYKPLTFANATGDVSTRTYQGIKTVEWINTYTLRTIMHLQC